MTTPTQEALRQESLEHLWIPTQSHADLAADDGLLVIRKGDGIFLHDDQGREYIDAMSGLWLNAVGHGRTELADIAHEQMSTLAYSEHVRLRLGSRRWRWASKLHELTPSTIRKAVFVNGGSGGGRERAEDR